MMDVKDSGRGQPILFLGLLLASWVLLRIVTWQTPWIPLNEAREAVRMTATVSTSLPEGASGRLADPVDSSQRLPSIERAPITSPEWTAMLQDGSDDDASEYEKHFVPGAHASGHNLLWLSAMAGLPMPREVSALLQRERSDRATNNSQPMLPGQQRSERRWHADAWLLLRQGATPDVALVDRPSSYGGSQAGAVVSFRLDPGSHREPQVYARVTKALVRDGESELASGLGFRPLRFFPIKAHAELRATRRGDDTEIRPAAFVAGGVDDAPLPLGLAASGYAQAGVVGGRFGTAFADGALRVGRSGERQVDVALGAWGGAQRGSARLDIGPSLQLNLLLGGAPTTLSADYRMRVAGDAQPGSGAALTIISGF